jgi:serine/threonine protein kinase
MDDKTEISQGKPKLGNEPDGRTVADVTPAGTDQRSIALPGETVPAAPEPEALRAIEDAVAAEWNEGDILLDLYEVLGVLGEGGMGKVYRIRHRAWNLDLAVKSPRPETIAQAGGKENFIREAETWVNLGLHPHTVSCYYVRTLGGIPRVFAELVEGGSLADWIRTRKLYEGGPEKALERILDIAIQFAWGLQHAHEHGLIHQDVKPANVMMTPDGTAKVTDFGLAKARGLVRERSEVIAGGSVLVSAGGMTPAYCSPEQAARQPLSRKTDIWSWGVSVLEMFTGEVTWLAGQAAAQALQSYREAETGEAALPRMPEAIAALLTKCFALDPLARPKDMHQVVEELQGIYRACMGTDYARPAPRAADLLADGLNNRGVSLLDLGRKEEAEKAFDRALQADAHHLEASYNRGLLLWRSGRMTDDVLVKQLEEVRTTHTGDWRDEYLLGLVHMERGDGKSAVTILEAASRQAPQEAEIHGALEVACSSQEEWHSWVRTFEGHADSVLSVSICPDGRWVLSGSEDKTLRLWELATGQCVWTFEGHTSPVNSVSISPDGCWALSGGHDKTVRLWELATGQCVRTFEGHANWVDSVSISPDGRWALSGSSDNTLRLWEFDWECEFTPPVDWNEGARPHLENFLSLHTPYEAILPRDRKPSEEEVQQVLTRRGAPSWTEDDFKDLLNRLCFAGYGWLRPQGIRQKLEEMATTWTVSPHEPKHGVPASLGAPAETVKKNAASSRIGALAAVLQAQEESAGLKQTPRPSPLPTMAATPPAREGGREQIDGQQALLLEKIVEQLEARGQPGIAQQLRAGSLGKPKSQPAPTPRLLPQKKAAAQSARGRKTRGIPRRLPNAALTFKLAWLAGWLVLILDQIAGKSLGLHLLPASEFRTPIDRCWDAGALGVAAILLLMIAPFVIERVAAGRKGR